MKKSKRIKGILFCIAFTVLMLYLKDNLGFLWDIICKIAEILTPFIIGFLFAYIINFPYKFFYNRVFGKMGTKHEHLKKMKKPFSILCSYMAIFGIIVAISIIVVPQIIVNLANLITDMPGYIGKTVKLINDFLNNVNSTFGTDFNITSGYNYLIEKISQFFTAENMSQVLKTAGTTSEFLFKLIADAAGGMFNFIMGLIISVYFLSSKESLCRQIKRIAVAYIPVKALPVVYEIVDITDTKCGRFLIGNIIDAGIVGILHFIILSICQIPYAPLISVLVAVTNLIPFFGPIIGSIPSCFILLIVNPWYMVWFLVINIILQQIDGNLIKPKVLGNQVGLSGFWVLFSVLVGQAMFGMVGLLLGTPIFAVIYYMVGKYTRIKIESKGKVAQEALDFEVLNYAKIAKEQKKLREEKENQQREKIRKLMHLEKTELKEEQVAEEETEKVEVSSADDVDNPEKTTDTEDK